MSTVLYYFHDPMCGWCYAFQPVLRQLKRSLSREIQLVSILGGLAPDDDNVMDSEMQEYIKGHWRRIQQMVPGTELNFDFWDKCEPRRSTYPACRAVIAASRQGDLQAEEMVEAIQRAYYREARNPSDRQTHIELANELGLNGNQFETDLLAPQTQAELEVQVNFTQSVGVRGFPALVLVKEQVGQAIEIDYNSVETVSASISEAKRALQAHDNGQQE